MLYAVISAAYLIIGIVFLYLSWNDERDEWYGELSVGGRYLFFAGHILLWPFYLIYLIFRRIFRGKPLEEEECG